MTGPADKQGCHIAVMPVQCRGCGRAQLRDRESRLSDMVDMVVEGYHVGFARSIQNYSQILALFQDARQQVRCLATLFTALCLRIRRRCFCCCWQHGRIR